MQRSELQDILSRLAADAQLWDDFLELCDCGGRRAGTQSEERAIRFLERRLGEIGIGNARVHPIRYAGWRCREAHLTLLDSRQALTCTPLLGTQSTPPEGLTAEVIDLGRGTLEQFERHAREIAGRVVLVRHEYPFAAEHLHRRRKIGWAMERGAAGFIIVNPFPGSGPVSGSSGRAGGAGIPAVATDYESAMQLAPSNGRLPRVELQVTGEDYLAETKVITLDLPGETEARVILSAHLDGHDLAESAMDNATGVAVAIAVARALVPSVAHFRRRLRICLFSAEEWALAGSRHYLDELSETERKSFVLNINLDTVGGDPELTALTSEFPALDPFVHTAAAQVGMRLRTYQPMMPNSDHFNFARHGIPALRLVAGFDNPASNVRHILTRADTRDKVAPAQLENAAVLAAALVWAALTASDSEIAKLR